MISCVFRRLDEATCNDVLNDARNSKGYVGFKVRALPSTSGCQCAGVVVEVSQRRAHDACFVLLCCTPELFHHWILRVNGFRFRFRCLRHVVGSRQIGPPSSQRLLRDVAAGHDDEDLEIAIGVAAFAYPLLRCFAQLLLCVRVPCSVK